MNDTDQPVVSVSLITYNHARFIEKAVEGVLMQQTNFPFELVIGEDESKDGTREIVERYAAAHPDKIRVHLHSRASNIGYGGKPTGRFNFVNNIRSCRGKYIALLDGDDYWTDPRKLQRQVDFLEQHPECAICFHRALVVDENDALIDVPSNVKVVQPAYSLNDYLEHRFFPRTCTVMFRRGLFPDFPEWYFACPVGDFPMHVMNALHGDFGFLDETMAAYRIHAGGLWSEGIRPGAPPPATREEQQKQARRFSGMVHLYQLLEQNLPGKYKKTIRRSIAQFATEWTRMNQLLGDRTALRKSALTALLARPSPWHLLRPHLLLALLSTWLPAKSGKSEGAPRN